MSLQRKIVPKSQRSKRALEQRDSKLIENVKKLLLIKGPSTNEVVVSLLKDLHKLKQPNAHALHKRNATRPFEDIASLEFLAQTNDASLFAYISHSKKRAQNLILGRLFDAQLTGMVECQVSHYESLASFEGKRQAVVRQGSKPMFVFQGAAFESNDELKLMQSLLLDTFRGEILTHINLSALDHVIVVTASEDANSGSSPVVHVRHYGILLKKSGSRLPRVELDPVGPNFDLTLRRTKLGSSSLIEQSMKQSKLSTNSRVMARNMEVGRFGEKHGRVHMQRQNLDNLVVRKTRGMKRSQMEAAAGADAAAGEQMDIGASEGQTQQQIEDQQADKRSKRVRIAQ